MRGRIFALIYLATTLSSCSVIMASKGSEDVNIAVLKIGATREDVESVLGKPIAPLRKETPGDVVSYQYFSGDEPSYKRAAVYGLLDAVTLGIAEVVFTPIEALQGDKHIIEVSYDRSDKIEKYDIYFQRAPLEKPEKILGLSTEENNSPAVEAQLPQTTVDQVAQAPTPSTPPARAALAEMTQF